MRQPDVIRARPLREWDRLFRDEGGPAFAALAKIYGSDRPRLRRKADFVLEALEAFARTFRGDTSVVLVRSTGRINLIGMHVDHRGGAVNPIAVRETWCLCEPRADDVLDCACRRSRLFPRRKFSISAEIGAEKIADWDRWTQSLTDKRVTEGTAGDWINYVKSSAIFLEHAYIRRIPSAPPLRGMNMLVDGTVPLGAGLSSSSSVVVGAMEALVHINNLRLSAREIVEFCGEAEWYVGTRGGAGDHAAIKFGRLGHVSHLGSYPLTVDAVPFPEEMRVVLCDSLVEAKKSEGARDEFNNRIASYEFGLMLLKQRFPERASRMEFLRDVNPETLGVSEAKIYEMLLSLPRRMSRNEILAALPEHADRVHHIFGSHAEPQSGYPVRGVCAFGIAECIRSNLAAEALRCGDMAAFGEITSVSHNGDRVTCLDAQNRRVSFAGSLADADIGRRIADLQSNDPARMERARLWRMPGEYNVSLPELDTIVDAALAAPGVVTARGVGAGLGGSVHVIARKDHVDEVIENIIRAYYEPRGLDSIPEVYTPVSGSGVFDVEPNS